MIKQTVTPGQKNLTIVKNKIGSKRWQKHVKRLISDTRREMLNAKARHQQAYVAMFQNHIIQLKAALQNPETRPDLDWLVLKRHSQKAIFRCAECGGRLVRIRIKKHKPQFCQSCATYKNVEG
jgi:hypothetical protein